MLLEIFEDLPDYMPVKILEKYFMDILDYAEHSKDVSNEEVSEVLYELTIRQWHTYELLNEVICDRIERWIGNVWDTKSIVLVDSLTSVISNLGLQKSFTIVKF